MVVGDFSVAGKIAAVTGGGSGIGLKFVETIVNRGCKALIADIRLTEPAKDLITRCPEQVTFVETDVTKRDQLENIIAVSETKFGDIPTIFVPAAGVFEPDWSSWWTDTEQDNYAALDINITHPLKLTRIAMRTLLRRKKKGVVLHLASSAGLYGVYPAALYSTSKHAIVGFVKSMAQADEQEGIKIIAICPGIVRTPLWTDRPEMAKRFNFSDERAITPEEAAQAMVEIVESGKYGGGTCMTVNKRGRQVVEFPQPPHDPNRPAPVYPHIKEILEVDKGTA